MITEPTQLETASNACSFMFDEIEWPETSAYRCDIALFQEDDGQFSAIVLNLPGAASCGDTEAGALESVKESIRGLIEVYKEHSDPIPWKNYKSEDIPENSKIERVLVNV
jgi:predicted RNase H-like HicB family nuclease